MAGETAKYDAVALGLLAAGMIGCVLGFVPTAWPAAEIDAFDYPKELVLHASVLPAAAVAWLVAARRPRLRAVDVALCAFVAGGIASAIAAQPSNPWLAWRAAALSASAAAAFFAVRWLDARGKGGAIVAIVAGAAVLVAGTVVLEAQGGPGASLPSRAPSGTQGIRNYAGHLIALGLPALWLVVHAAARRRTAILAGGGIALAAAAVVLTRSRASWLALAAAAGVALAARLVFRRSFRGLSRERSAIALGAAALGAAFALWAPHRLAWREDQPYLTSIRTLAESDSGSGRGRLLQYGNSLAMIADHPLLGVGPGQWHAVYPRYAPPDDPSVKPKAVWNTPARSTGDWIGHAAERGVPAALALAAFVALVAAACLRGLRGPGDAPRSLAVLATCAVVVVVAAFDCPLQMALPSFAAFAVLALAPRPAAADAPVLPRSLRIAGAAVLLAAACALVAITGRQVIALRLASSASSPSDWERITALSAGHPRMHLWAAWAYGRTGDEARALDHARAALALDPELGIVRTLATALARQTGAVRGP